MRKTICALVAGILSIGCAVPLLSSTEMDRITYNHYKGPVTTPSGQKKNLKYTWDSDYLEGEICEKRAQERETSQTNVEICFRVKPDYTAGRLRVMSFCVSEGEGFNCYYPLSGLLTNEVFQQAQDRVDAYSKGILEGLAAEEAKYRPPKNP